MSKFYFQVVVTCESLHEAQQVMAERLGYDEDYGFKYTIDCQDINPNDDDLYSIEDEEDLLPNTPIQILIPFDDEYADEYADDDYYDE